MAKSGLPRFLDRPTDVEPCLILVGMAGAGKTTIGRAVARALAWAHVDTDHIMEAWWGQDLESLRQRLGLEDFLRAEEQTILYLNIQRAVISTGGSVVYSEPAMRRLRAMGTIVHIHAGLDTIRSRIEAAPNRGLAMPPGYSLDDVYYERQELYLRYEQFRVSTDGVAEADAVQTILDLWLKKI
ncbi:MAG: shikimate kinase [Deltaproteobacteria bacterium]|nr:shikimate kinase [Deltaproteobacteria bacterium]